MGTVICAKCGHHKEVEGTLMGRQYFPNKWVESDNCTVRCDNCHDDYMIVYGEDYICLMLRDGITGDNRTYVKKSNEAFITKELEEIEGLLVTARAQDNVRSTKIHEASKDYWKSQRVINNLM